MPIQSKNHFEVLQKVSFSAFDDFQQEAMAMAMRAQFREDVAGEEHAERGRIDKQFFAEYFLADHLTFPFGEHHIQWFTRPYRRGGLEAIAAPRGSAKTTFFSFIEPLHDIYYGAEHFIIIISETKTLAVERVQDLKMEIDSNERLRSAFGEIKGDVWRQDEFVANGVRVVAKGTGGQIRGSKFGSHRPSKIILDDVESTDSAMSPIQRSKTRNWYQTDVRRAGSPEGTTNFLVVGTYLHQDALLPHLVGDNPAYEGQCHRAVETWSKNEALWAEWKDLYTNLTLSDRIEQAETFYGENKAELLDGVEMLWPEGIDYLTVQKAIVADGLQNVLKEYQNEPYDPEKQLFDMAHAVTFTLSEDGLVRSDGRTASWDNIVGASLFLDWAGGKDTLDNCFACAVIVLWEKLEFGDINYRYVLDAMLVRKPISGQIAAVFDLHAKYPEFSTRFAIEDFPKDITGLIHDGVRKAFAEEHSRRDREGLPNDITLQYLPRNTSKLERITAGLEPLIANGWLAFSDRLPQAYMDQMIQFPTHEFLDAPDATEGALSIKPQRRNTYVDRHQDGSDTPPRTKLVL